MQMKNKRKKEKEEQRKKWKRLNKMVIYHKNIKEYLSSLATEYQSNDKGIKGVESNFTASTIIFAS